MKYGTRIFYFYFPSSTAGIMQIPFAAAGRQCRTSYAHTQQVATKTNPDFTVSAGTATPIITTVSAYASFATGSCSTGTRLRAGAYQDRRAPGSFRASRFYNCCRGDYFSARSI